MGEQMDMARLRSLIDGVLLTLYRRYTEKELPALCERLGLPSSSEGNTRHERLAASLKACSDDRLPDVAEAVFEQEELAQTERRSRSVGAEDPILAVPEISRRLGGGSEPANGLCAQAVAASAIACLDVATDAWTSDDGTTPLSRSWNRSWAR
ncbi:hypothetical protein ABZ016_39385 [Streptomyces sp. NPDC006372]|uniref:hypothetical protein n=1 Tax=Streptomyces sp. NPDC006372 TaxID=3155599 RepID=UPI0033BA908B